MTTKEQIKGTWKLISMEVRNAEGELSQLFGDKPEGMLIYTDGHISVQVMHSDRPHFASGDFSVGTPEEFKAAFMGMSTYFGSYELSGDEGDIYHHVQGNSFPNESDRTIFRRVEVSGTQLTLIVPPMLIDGEQKGVELLWERIE